MHHWIKNIFVLIPAFFAARLFEPALFSRAIVTFAGFSLVASAVYMFNDLMDIEMDRQHPRKRLRPIAQGLVSATEARAWMALTACSGLAMLFQMGWTTLCYALLYILLNVLYSWRLKHFAIIDISLIALGFLLRVYIGGAATGVEVSNWLTVLTFILALILGLSKRRGEYITFSEGITFRKSLEGYNLPFLNASITIFATVAIVAYLMYCFSPDVTQRMGNKNIYFTAFFVILGLLRLLQLALVEERSDSPTRLLIEDLFLQIVLLAWVGSFAYLLYFAG